MAKEIDKIIQSKTAPKSKNVLWDDYDNLKINRNGKWSNVNSTSNRIVNSVEELGALDVPLGTVASIVKEDYEEQDYFTNAVKKDNFTLKGIVVNENLTFSDLLTTEVLMWSDEWIINWSYEGSHLNPIIKGIEFIKYPDVVLRLCYANPGSKVEINYDNIQEMNKIIAANSNNDFYLDSNVDKFLQGIFSYPSEVDTYIKTEKGLDLPTAVYRKFSDFGEQPELFPKEERVVKNFEILDAGNGGYAGGVEFETKGGTRIFILTQNNQWYIRYDDSENISLDDIELQKFKDLINTTTVYYIHVGGSPSFKNYIDNLLSADFPPIYKSVELTTWSKVYTQQDALTDSEIDSIMNEVFGGGGYYYYGDTGIGEFDLDEEQISEGIEPVNIENDETNSQP